MVTVSKGITSTAFLVWGFFAFMLLAALALLLLSAGIEDVRRREIGNGKNAAIALLAPLWWWANGVPLWPGVAIQIGIALVVFALFCWAFHLGMMGGGDVKMIGALALWLPFQPLMGMLMAMALAGGVVTMLMIAEHKWKKNESAIEVPYGVAIAIAGLLAIREPIINTFG